MRRTVVLTTSRGSFSGLRDALGVKGATVEEHPLISFAPPLDWQPVDTALDRLPRYAVIAFTSPRAARSFVARARERLGEVASEPMPAVWAGGQGTAVALGAALGPVRVPNPESTGELGAAAALADSLLKAGVKGRVLVPCGETRREELAIVLRLQSIEVDEVECYRSVLSDETAARTAAQRADVVVVASPSVAQLLARACPAESRPPLVAVGPTTAAAAAHAGWPAAGVAAYPTAEALAAAVRPLLTATDDDGAP